MQKKKPGRHRKTCRCPKCETRRATAANVNPAPEPETPAAVGMRIQETPGDFSGDSSTPVSNSSGNAAPDNFERVAAITPAVIGDGTGADMAQPAAGIPGASVPPADGKIGILLSGITPESVEKWLNVPFNVAARATGRDDLKLMPHEIELFVPPLRVYAEQYLPQLLAKTDKPELAMLGVAVMTYASRVALSTWANKAKQAEEIRERAGARPVVPGVGMPAKPAAVGTVPGSLTAGFQASSASSVNPAPAKVF
jgi:hypothetical protein